MNLLSLWNVHVQTDRASVSSYIGFEIPCCVEFKSLGVDFASVSFTNCLD